MIKTEGDLLDQAMELLMNVDSGTPIGKQSELWIDKYKAFLIDMLETSSFHIQSVLPEGCQVINNNE